MSSQLLGIDIGGSVIKVAVFDATGTLLAQASKRSVVEADSPGFAERDPEVMWESAVAAIREVLADPSVVASEVGAVGVTGFGNGLFLVDEKGQPTRRGIGSIDTRAQSIVTQWREAGWEDLAWESTFQPFWSGQPLPLLEWVSRHDPDALSSASRVLSAKDVLTSRLTGELWTERTDLGSGGLFDPVKGRPAYELFDQVGLGAVRDLIPEDSIARSDQIIGTVTASVANLTGLREGTPVSAGTTDNLAVVIGSGVTDVGHLSVIGGTWGLNQVYSAEPVTDQSVFQSIPTHLDDMYLLVESTPNSMSNFDWYVRSLLRVPSDVSEHDLYHYCDEQYERSQADHGGRVVFMPHLYGSPRHPWRSGAVLGLTGDTKPLQVLAAVYEGVVFEHRILIDRLGISDSSAPARISGGILRSRVWQQLYADVLNRVIEVPNTDEAGARGAAMTAGVAAGVFTSFDDASERMTAVAEEVVPQPERVSALNERFDRYARLRDVTAELDIQAVN